MFFFLSIFLLLQCIVLPPLEATQPSFCSDTKLMIGLKYESWGLKTHIWCVCREVVQISSSYPGRNQKRAAPRPQMQIYSLKTMIHLQTRLNVPHDSLCWHSSDLWRGSRMFTPPLCVRRMFHPPLCTQSQLWVLLVFQRGSHLQKTSLCSQQKPGIFNFQVEFMENFVAQSLIRRIGGVLKILVVNHLVEDHC